MRKLAMLLAAVLTFELVAPATAYAQPADYTSEVVAEETTEEETTVEETTEETSTEETTTEEETTEEETQEALVLDNSVSENEIFAEAPLKNVTALSEAELYLEPTYYKTKDGYPLVASVVVPISGTWETNFTFKSLTLSIDGGEEKKLTVNKTTKQGRNYNSGSYESYNVGFNAGYDASITEGTRNLTYTAVINDGTNDYSFTVSKKANFVDDRTDTEKIYPLKSSEHTQYMSNTAGSSIKMIHEGINATSNSETIKSLQLRKHDTGDMFSVTYSIDSEGIYVEEDTCDVRYQPLGDDNGNIWPHTIFTGNGIVIYEYIDAVLNSTIPEGTYDLVYTTSAGKKHILENRYQAVHSALVDYSIESMHHADNTGDYISVYVYGLNIKENNAPVFYLPNDMDTPLTEYDLEDGVCGMDAAGEWGATFTVKKKDPKASVWTLNDGYTNLTAKMSGDVIYENLNSYNQESMQYYYYAGIGYRVEYFENEKQCVRIYLSKEYVKEGDTVTVTAIDYAVWENYISYEEQSVVQNNGYEYYIELSGEIYENWHRFLDFVVTVGSNSSGTDCGTPDEIWADNNALYVPKNSTWEVHAAKDNTQVICKGKTGSTAVNDVLSAAQKNEIAKRGLVRICIYNQNGVQTDQYCAYFKGEATYTIDYELNGGENHQDNPPEYDSSETVVLKDPTREHYTFAGWYSDANFKTKVTSIPKGSKGDKTFYAKWEPYTYKVAYNANGGTGKVNETSCKYDVDATIAKNAFTRTGYTFKEWNTESDGTGDTYQENGIVRNLTEENKKTITLYAIWKPITYTVILDKNSEDATAGTLDENAEGYIAEYGGTICLSGDEFIREGYTIASWNTKPDGKGKKVANGEVTNLTATEGDTITLYAQWAIKNYTITYDYDGGKVKKANPKSYTYETDDIKLNNPEKTGYVFEGYFTEDPNSEEFTGEEEPIPDIKKGERTGDLHLYAKWRPIFYTIIFKDNTGAEYRDGFNEESARVKMSYDGTITFTDDLFVKKGYTLSSWNSKENGKGTKYLVGRGYKNLTKQDGAEITLYAVWTKDTYSITYQLDGGKNNSKNPKKYAVDTDTITLLEPSKTGYEFKGWFETDSEGQLSEERKTEIVKGSTGNLKLTAKWEAMKYEIKLNPNTTEYLSSEDQTPITWEPYAYEDDVTPSSWENSFIPKNEYKNTGYGILYWSTKPNGSGTKYYPGKVYSGLTTSGTVELYAKWGLKKYTVTYEGTSGVKNTNPTTYTYHATKKVALKDLTKTGYTFGGWYTNQPFTEESKVKEVDCSKCEDITLYAEFTPITYTVTLMPNGADVTAKENLDEEFTKDYDETFTLAADSYEREHYYIAYWTTKANGSGTKVKSGEVKNLTTKSSITLYPKWELISYDITYNNVVFEGEKVVNKNPATYKYSATKDVKLNNPTRPGYVFGGWYSDDTTAVGFNPEKATRITKIEKTKAGNIALYAYWTPIRYTIKLEANAKDAESGSITIGSAAEKIEIGYGDAVTFAQNSYKRKGYILTGFNTKANGRGTMYGFGELSYIYSAKANSTVKVYAIWKKVDTKMVTGVSLVTTEDFVVAMYEGNEGCTKYEAAISSSITMRNKTAFTVSGLSATFFGLERGQRYFVRVREVRYDSCGNEIKGPWSIIRTIKVTE